MKRCIKCLTEKNISEFYQSKSNKDGYKNKCKECTKDCVKLYAFKNKDVINEKKKEYRNINKEKYADQSKKWRENNKEYKKLKDKEYQIKNKEKIKEKSKEYRNAMNKEDIKNYNSNYYLNNKEVILLKNSIYKKKKKENDSLFKLSENIRTLVSNSFRRSGFSKNSKTNEIICSSFEDFKLYLESKFEDWMTWENRGLYNGELNYGWDIDHIIPISSAETEEEIIKLNHYTNLQPLCSYKNRNIKKNKIQNEVY